MVAVDWPSARPFAILKTLSNYCIPLFQFWRWLKHSLFRTSKKHKSYNNINIFQFNSNKKNILIWIDFEYCIFKKDTLIRISGPIDVLKQHLKTTSWWQVVKLFCCHFSLKVAPASWNLPNRVGDPTLLLVSPRTGAYLWIDCHNSKSRRWLLSPSKSHGLCGWR